MCIIHPHATVDYVSFVTLAILLKPEVDMGGTVLLLQNVHLFPRLPEHSQASRAHKKREEERLQDRVRRRDAMAELIATGQVTPTRGATAAGIITGESSNDESGASDVEGNLGRGDDDGRGEIMVAGGGRRRGKGGGRGGRDNGKGSGRSQSRGSGGSGTGGMLQGLVDVVNTSVAASTGHQQAVLDTAAARIGLDQARIEHDTQVRLKCCCYFYTDARFVSACDNGRGMRRPVIY